MAKIDLEQLDFQGLRDVISRAQALMAKKQGEARTQFLKEMRTKAAALGLDLQDVIKPTRRATAKPTQSTVAPKYKNPDNPSQTWSGRGRSPAWAQPYKEQGRLDDIRIGD
jgi:DNA-binding protein H-NS